MTSTARSAAPLQELIHGRAAEAPLPFDEFMRLALYHPDHGYYARGPRRSGWGGHYLTAPELDPGFGELWVRALHQIWESCGEPRAFEVVELGAGEGGFAEACLVSMEGELGEAITYRIVEPLPALRIRQQERLSAHPIVWSDTLSDVPIAAAGCIFANELLDNLPVCLVEQGPTGIAELGVASEGTHLALKPLRLRQGVKSFLAEMPSALPHGHRMEIPLAVEELVSAAATRIQTGALVFVDYGHEEEVLVEMPLGTLICYSERGVDDRLLDRVGEKDVTAHVNWTALRRACSRAGLEPLGPVTQRAVLQKLGLDELLDEAGEAHRAAISEGRGSDAVRQLSRRQSLAVIADTGGLGRLQVFAALKGIPKPSFLTP